MHQIHHGTFIRPTRAVKGQFVSWIWHRKGQKNRLSGRTHPVSDDAKTIHFGLTNLDSPVAATPSQWEYMPVEDPPMRYPLSYSPAHNADFRDNPPPEDLPYLLAWNAGDRDAIRQADMALMSDGSYLHRHLKTNDIFYIDLSAYSEVPLPSGPAAVLSRARAVRGSPPPSRASIVGDDWFTHILTGRLTSSRHVEEEFLRHFFPDDRDLDGFRDKIHLSKRLALDTGYVPAKNERWTPVTPSPDLMFGYRTDGGRATPAFSAEQTRFLDIQSRGSDGLAHSGEDLVFPFFIVETESDRPLLRGNARALVNQCLGGGSTCSSIAERLNEMTREAAQAANVEPPTVNNTVWSITLSHARTVLYMTWKEEGKCFTRCVDQFLIHKPEDYIRLRRMLRNILDWAREERLESIRRCIQFLIDPTASDYDRVSRPLRRSSRVSSQSKRRG